MARLTTEITIDELVLFFPNARRVLDRHAVTVEWEKATTLDRFCHELGIPVDTLLNEIVDDPVLGEVS